MLSTGFFVPASWFVGLEVIGFGGDEEDDEEKDGEEEEEQDGVDELDDEDVTEDVEEVSDSEPLPSECSASFGVWCLKDGNTVGARTDRLGIRNIVLGERLRFR